MEIDHGQKITSNKTNVLSPIDNKYFVEPRKPSSIRKPQKRIRSPTLDGEFSPGKII